jgi:uncharacterized protein YciI
MQRLSVSCFSLSFPELFCFQCRDRPNTDKIRRQFLQDHIDYLARQKMCGILVMASASQHAWDSKGRPTILSQFVLNVDSVEEAKTFVHDDPFNQQKLYFEITYESRKVDEKRRNKDNQEVR